MLIVQRHFDFESFNFVNNFYFREGESKHIVIGNGGSQAYDLKKEEDLIFYLMAKGISDIKEIKSEDTGVWGQKLQRLR